MCYAMEYENEYLAKHPGKFFPDFFETVERLKKEGKMLYIVSNCQSGYIEAMLKAAKLPYGEGKTFQDIECFGNTGKSKAENIVLLMERNGIRKDEAVYLGDTALDQKSAEEAGIPFIFASYGFGHPEKMRAKICGLPELPEVLSKL